MTSSTYSVVEASIGDRLTRSWTKPGRRIPNWLEHDVSELIAGPGGVITNVIDMIVYDTGGLPGFSRLTAFLPSDHFGIVVLMNADEKMEAMDILTKSIDEVFETKRGETSIRNPLMCLYPSFTCNVC